MNKKIFLLLFAVTLISFFLHVAKFTRGPICLNADEAAFGYNAYSLIKTGRDEYGSPLPFRFKSFGENKLPMLGYLMVPSIALFGTNEFSTRIPTMIVGILSPLLLYFLAREFTNNKKIGMIAAILTALSPWLQTITDHAHEVVFAYFFISLSILFFLRHLKTNKFSFFLLFCLAGGVSLFTHHIAKVFAVFFFAAVTITVIKKRMPIRKHFSYLLLFLIPVFIFFATEYLHPTNRVGNLAFYNTAGFSLSIAEKRGEHPTRLIHNKLTHGVITITHQYLTYFSPNFLILTGDLNLRFGHVGISPITPPEYILVLVGLYYLFQRKERLRYLLLLLLLVSPLPAALAWQESSLTRAYYMIVPIIVIASYGGYYLVSNLRRNRQLAVAAILIVSYLFFTIYSWEFYFYHYFKKPDVIRAWQCGYKELTNYVKENYNKYDTFVITRKNGQPYIYLLYYLQYDPQKYQKEAVLSKTDEFGFGTVEKFDKFNFNFSYNPKARKTAFVGYPEDFNPSDIKGLPIKKITLEGHDVFWIVENN